MSLDVFLPDRDERFYLLKAHRHPVGDNVARAWIEQQSAPGQLIVDPFAGAGTVARAAVELGRRAIAVDSNPLVAWAARVQSSLPSPRAVLTTLARVAEIQREGQPLGDHLDQLYASQCGQCSGLVVADYFGYQAGALAEKSYICENCGPRRDPVNEADLDRAAEYKPRSLQYHLMLQRLSGEGAPGGPQWTELARERLQWYTPRNLYALTTLTLKLDTEFRDEPGQVIALACLLHALDVGSSLYPTLGGLPERKPPESFIERNVWRAFEEAARGLAEHAPGIPLAKSALEAAQAQTPVAFVGHGSARTLAEALGANRAALVVSSPTRLDPAFWELSFIWTRWLLGRAAGVPLEPLLDEKRQRWGWYGEALTNALRDTASFMIEGGALAVAFPSGSHAMIEALALAALPVFALQAFSFRPHRGARETTEFGALRGDYRAVWTNKRPNVPAAEPVSAKEAGAHLRIGAREGAEEALITRGEPLAYSWLHHGALVRLARAGTLAETLAAHLGGRDNPFLFLHHQLEAGLKEGYAHDLDHWQGKHRVLWLLRGRRQQAPLVARVEEAVLKILNRTRRISNNALQDQLLAEFSGLLTPEIELVESSARAYADWQNGEWCAREGADGGGFEQQAREQLAQLGERLAYRVREAEKPYALVWQAEKIVPASSSGAATHGHRESHSPLTDIQDDRPSVAETRVYEDAFVFLIRARVELDELVKLSPSSQEAEARRGLIVIPETQVELTREKLWRNPLWAQELTRRSWEWLRLLFVAQLLAEMETERPEFQLAWGLDPALARGKEQMELF